MRLRASLTQSSLLLSMIQENLDDKVIVGVEKQGDLSTEKPKVEDIRENEFFPRSNTPQQLTDSGLLRDFRAQ